MTPPPRALRVGLTATSSCSLTPNESAECQPSPYSSCWRPRPDPGPGPLPPGRLRRLPGRLEHLPPAAAPAPACSTGQVVAPPAGDVLQRCGCRPAVPAQVGPARSADPPLTSPGRGPSPRPVQTTLRASRLACCRPAAPAGSPERRRRRRYEVRRLHKSPARSARWVGSGHSRA